MPGGGDIVWRRRQVAGARPVYPAAALAAAAIGAWVAVTADDRRVQDIVGPAAIALALVALVCALVWFPRTQIREGGLLQARSIGGWRRVDLTAVERVTVMSTMRATSDRVRSQPTWNLSIGLHRPGDGARAGTWVSVASPPLEGSELARFVEVLERFAPVDVRGEQRAAERMP